MRVTGNIVSAVIASAIMLGVICLGAGRAQAATVVLIQTAGSSPELEETVSRLRGELLSLGLQVEVAERAERPAARKLGGTDRRLWLQRDPSGSSPAAVIETVGDVTPVAVDIWVYDRRRRTAEVSRLTLEPNVEDPAGRLAIHAVEVLRSSLLAIDFAAPQKGDDGQQPAPRDLGKDDGQTVPVAAPSATIARESEKPSGPALARFGVEAGGVVLSSLDGVGPALLPIVRFDWRAHLWLALQVTLAGFGTHPTIRTATGSARVAQQYGLVGLRLCAPEPQLIGLYLALSAGMLRTAIDGQTEAPNDAHSIRQSALLVDASAGARVRLPGRYYLSLAAHLQLAAPYVAVFFVDTQVATTGRPNVLVSLTVGAQL